MYECDMFIEQEMITWEYKTENLKTWDTSKMYFVTLYADKHLYQEDTKAAKSGYESVISFDKASHQISGANSVSGRTAVTSMRSLRSAPSNEWVEYTDSLEDSLVEAVKFAAAVTSKSDLDQAEILEELREQRKQTALALDQNTKLMAILAK